MESMRMIIPEQGMRTGVRAVRAMNGFEMKPVNAVEKRDISLLLYP